MDRGVANTMPANYSVDVAVYDGTSGGVMAAVAAARHGATVLLLCASYPACFREGGFRLGGMASGGLGQSDIGSCSNDIGGLAREFYRRNRRLYGDTSEPSPSEWYSPSRTPRAIEANAKLDQAHAAAVASCRLPSPGCNMTFNLEPHKALAIFEAMVKAEPRVTLLYGVQVNRVEKSGRHIARLHLTDGSSVQAGVFVEASYEGDLISRAGASYAVARESDAQYNETLGGRTAGNCPRCHQFTFGVDPHDAEGKLLPLMTANPHETLGQADGRVQAYNFRLCVTQNKSNALPFPEPAGYDAAKWELLRRAPPNITAPSCNTAMVPGAKFDLNNCGPVSTDFIGASTAYPEADYEARKATHEGGACTPTASADTRPTRTHRRARRSTPRTSSTCRGCSGRSATTRRCRPGSTRRGGSAPTSSRRAAGSRPRSTSARRAGCSATGSPHRTIQIGRAHV